MRIATFNIQNLRLRRHGGVLRLDGAVDRDAVDAPRSEALDIADRRRAAMLLHAADADVVALQEVFDTATLDHFHDEFLCPAGVTDYGTRICLPGNDGQGLNVAALSRRRPVSVTSHARVTGAELGLGDLPAQLEGVPLFRRDCLRLGFGTVDLFICHFKAPYPDPEASWRVRRAEAAGVRVIVERAFPGRVDASWIILGDLNEPGGASPPSGSALAPLTDGFAVDLLNRLPPQADWTFTTPDTHLSSRPDRVLVSPALARRYPDLRPVILRAGMDSSQIPEPKAALGHSGPARPHASDHALVYADFPGL